MNVVYVLGTKAQFIKCKYILQYLYDSGIKLIIADTGQHKEITKNELKNVSFQYKYVQLSKNNKNISSIASMFFWFFKMVFTKRSNKFNDTQYCLIHGDTLSTLTGLIFGKVNKLKIVHLESGYKSHNLLRPFPEEIIRNIVSRFSDVLVVDGPEQFENVKHFNHKKEIIKLDSNTIYDSAVNSIEKNITYENKLIVTIHRTENVYNKKRLLNFVNLLVKIKKLEKFDKIIWFCHDITFNSLKRNNLIRLLSENDVQLNNLLTHQEFLSQILSSSMVITDGGSIAEECSILGLNTIIWRDVVENKRYLKENVILSEYRVDRILDFILNLKKSELKLDTKSSPSEDFVKKFLQLNK
jgi:UDP-N-acetylglucosamine 2-epimerase (non-hydrolysing)